MDKFCTAPWTSISTDVNGSIRPCCRYEQFNLQTKYKMPWMNKESLDESWNGEKMKKLRQTFIDGKQPNECRQCWNEEKSGLPSYRQRLNNLLDQYPRNKERYDFTSTEAPAPFYLDLKLSNVCNLKCRMCSPMASSLIQKEMEKQGGFKGDSYWHENKFLETHNEETFLKWLPHIDKITFTGGEPFMGKENKDMLQLMIDSGDSKRMDLHFNTNGMFMGNDIIEMLKQYKGVVIAFSVDDIGKRLNYHRSGADWERIRKNIKKAIDNLPDARIDIYCTVNNYNVWYLDEALNEFEELTKSTSYNFVYEPDYLSTRKLARLIKDEIEDKYGSDPKFEKLIKYLNSDKEDLTSKFHAHIRQMDKLRNENFAKIFPEWSEVIMYYE